VVVQVVSQVIGYEIFARRAKIHWVPVVELMS
jgi:hypothetical protein